MTVKNVYMGVSKNRGSPQIIHFNRVFQFKPSILGYPYFWKHPYVFSSYLPLVTNLSGPIKVQTGSHVQRRVRIENPPNTTCAPCPFLSCVSKHWKTALRDSLRIHQRTLVDMQNLSICLPCHPPCVGFSLPCSRISRHPC